MSVDHSRPVATIEVVAAGASASGTVDAESKAEFAALSPGPGVWIVPPLEFSSWARRIDFYLNFQLLRSQTHERPELSSELTRICESVGFHPPHVAASQATPIMVASSGLVPCRSTLMVPFSREKEAEWVRRIHYVWRSLGQPAIRVFLPDQFSLALFKAAWPIEDQAAPIELIPEPK